MHSPILPALLAAFATACSQTDHFPGGMSTAVAAESGPAVVAWAETDPVVSEGDAADDPAIWVNRRDPSASLIVGTDKRRGLQLYDLHGRLLQDLPDGRLNNVDLREGFMLAGRAEILVAATNRTDRTIAFYLLQPESRRLVAGGPPLRSGFDEPYGLCLYASRSGDFYVFANDAGSGRIRQWRLRDAGGRIRGERVREIAVGSQAEGCAADDESGLLFVAEENRGLWQYGAEPGSGRARVLIDAVGGRSGLTADLEGVAIWKGTGGRGYIVVSSQGSNSYALYRREAPHAFVGMFRIAANAERGVDGTGETDGLDVTSAAAGPDFPQGLLVVQDGRNEPAGQRQNFKLVSWRSVTDALGLAEQD